MAHIIFLCDISCSKHIIENKLIFKRLLIIAAPLEILSSAHLITNSFEFITNDKRYQVFVKVSGTIPS